MKYASKVANKYPPPIPPKAVVVPPEPVVNVCGTIINVVATVFNAELHTFSWAQISGPNVSFIVSGDGLTLSFVRAIAVNHVFRLTVDKGTSIETFADYTVTDSIESRVGLGLTNTKGVSVQRGVGGVAPIARIHGRLSSGGVLNDLTPTELQWDTGLTTGFKKVEIYESNDGVNFSKVGVSFIHTQQPTYPAIAGRFYYVKEYGSVTAKKSNTVISATSANYGLGKLNAYASALITLGTSMPTLDMGATTVRTVRQALIKLKTLVAPLGLVTTEATLGQPITVLHALNITKPYSSAIIPLSVTSTQNTNVLAGAFLVTRSNGTSAGEG